MDLTGYFNPLALQIISELDSIRSDRTTKLYSAEPARPRLSALHTRFLEQYMHYLFRSPDTRPFPCSNIPAIPYSHLMPISHIILARADCAEYASLWPW
jgi:hypothetical protein